MDRFSSLNSIGSSNFSGSNQNLGSGLGGNTDEIIEYGADVYGDPRNYTWPSRTPITGHDRIEVDPTRPGNIRIRHVPAQSIDITSPPSSLDSSGTNILRPGVDATPQYIEVDPPPNFQPPRTPTPVTPQDILDISQPTNTVGNSGSLAPRNAVQPFRGGLPANQWRNDPSLGQRLRTDLGGGGSGGGGSGGGGGSVRPRTSGVNPSVSSSGSFTRGTQAMPRSIPRAIGVGLRAVPPVLAAADFANQVRNGVPVAEAAARSGGGLAGGSLGGSVGAAVGQAVIPIPVVGAAVGGLVGGIVGGVGGIAAADRLYNEALNRFAGVDTAVLPPLIPTDQNGVTTIPFYGGQSLGVGYVVTFSRTDPQFAGNNATINSIAITGAIEGSETVTTGATGNLVKVFNIIHNGGRKTQVSSGLERFQYAIISIRRVDNQPDTGGNRYEPLAPMVLIPNVVNHPANTPYSDYFPRVADRQTQSGQGNEPMRVPSGRLAPSRTAPLQAGEQVVPTLPELQHSPTPLQSNPNWNYGLGIPVARMGGGTMNPLTSPGLNTNQGIHPFPELQRRTTRINLRQTEPDRNLGRVPPIFPPTGQTRATSPQPRRRRLRQQTVNRTNMPGSNPCTGCGAAIRQDVQRNNDLLNQLNTGLNAANTLNLDEVLARLAVINTKLGPQVNGGLSGFLQSFREKFDKFIKWTQLDRLLNILTFIAALHNAFMLSNQLGQTLVSAISNGLAAIGIRDEEGDAIDIGGLINGTVENIIIQIVGAENYEEISANWKRANRIYQAASNILFSLQSIMYSVLESLELIGSYVAKIGNAAKKFGVFAESCYQWMNPNPDFTQNRFFNALNNTQEAVETIDEIAGEVLNIQETSVQLAEQTTQFRNAVAGVDENGNPLSGGFNPPENVPTLTTEVSNDEMSQSPVITPESERTPVIVSE